MTGPTAWGTHELLSVYRVYPGWGSLRVTRCLADPEAVADNAPQLNKYGRAAAQ
jgi:hypothetical protein